MTAVAQWLRCCATNRKVAGSIPAKYCRLPNVALFKEQFYALAGRDRRCGTGD